MQIVKPRSRAQPRPEPLGPLMAILWSAGLKIGTCHISVFCLMCVSWKINTAKLRKINKCQRCTRSLSHLTIITLIWDMLTNLLSPLIPAKDRSEMRCDVLARPTGFWPQTKRLFSAFRCRPKHQTSSKVSPAACCVKLSN